MRRGVSDNPSGRLTIALIALLLLAGTGFIPVQATAEGHGSSTGGGGGGETGSTDGSSGGGGGAYDPSPNGLIEVVPLQDAYGAGEKVLFEVRYLGNTSSTGHLEVSAMYQRQCTTPWPMSTEYEVWRRVHHDQTLQPGESFEYPWDRILANSALGSGHEAPRGTYTLQAHWIENNGNVSGDISSPFDLTSGPDPAPTINVHQPVPGGTYDGGGTVPLHLSTWHVCGLDRLRVSLDGSRIIDRALAPSDADPTGTFELFQNVMVTPGTHTLTIRVRGYDDGVREISRTFDVRDRSTSTPPPLEPARWGARLDRSNYAPGDQVTITAFVEGSNDWQMDLKIFQAPEAETQNGSGGGANRIVGSWTLHPGDPMQVQWDQRDPDGNRVAPGEYHFSAAFTQHDAGDDQAAGSGVSGPFWIVPEESPPPPEPVLNIRVEVDRAWYGPDQHVRLRVINDGGRTTGQHLAFAIYEGRFGQNAVHKTTVPPLAPGEVWTLTWDRLEPSGQPAPSGPYTAGVMVPSPHGDRDRTYVVGFHLDSGTERTPPRPPRPEPEPEPGFGVRVFEPLRGAHYPTGAQLRVAAHIWGGPATRINVDLEGEDQHLSQTDEPVEPIEGRYVTHLDTYELPAGTYQLHVTAWGPGGVASDRVELFLGVPRQGPPEPVITDPHPFTRTPRQFPVVFHLADGAGVTYAEVLVNGELVGRTGWPVPVDRGVVPVHLPPSTQGLLRLQLVVYDGHDARGTDDVQVFVFPGIRPCLIYVEARAGGAAGGGGGYGGAYADGYAQGGYRHASAYPYEEHPPEPRDPAHDHAHDEPTPPPDSAESDAEARSQAQEARDAAQAARAEAEPTADFRCPFPEPMRPPIVEDDGPARPQPAEPQRRGPYDYREGRAGVYTDVRVDGRPVFDRVIRQLSERLDALGERLDEMELALDVRGRALTVEVDHDEHLQYDLNGTWVATQRGPYIVLENTEDGSRVLVAVVGGSSQLLGHRIEAQLAAGGRVVTRAIGDGPLEQHVTDAILEGRLAAEVHVPERGQRPQPVSYGDLEVTVARDGDRVRAVLATEQHEGRTVVFTLADDARLPAELTVWLDGEQLARASSLEDVLDPFDDDQQSEYYIVVDPQTGETRVLVSVGHFSTRELVIQGAQLVEPFLTPLALVGGLAVVGVATVALFRRERV